MLLCPTTYDMSGVREGLIVTKINLKEKTARIASDF